MRIFSLVSVAFRASFLGVALLSNISRAQNDENGILIPPPLNEEATVVPARPQAAIAAPVMLVARFGVADSRSLEGFKQNLVKASIDVLAATLTEEQNPTAEIVVYAKSEEQIATAKQILGSVKPYLVANTRFTSELLEKLASSIPNPKAVSVRFRTDLNQVEAGEARSVAYYGLIDSLAASKLVPVSSQDKEGNELSPATNEKDGSPILQIPPQGSIVVEVVGALGVFELYRILSAYPQFVTEVQLEAPVIPPPPEPVASN